MKNLKLTLLTFLLIGSNVSGQDSELRKYYKELLENNHIHIDNFPSTKKELIDSVFENYVSDVKKTKKSPSFNNAVLNKFFAKKITNYATNTGDVSFSNFFATVNSTENTLSLGKSFRMDNAFEFNKDKRKYIKMIRPLQKVENLLTIYLKADVSSSFASLYSGKSGGDFSWNNNIGLGGKFTHIYNGKITAKDASLIKKIREEFVQKEIKKELKDYSDAKFEKEIKLNQITDDVDGFETLSLTEEGKQSMLDKKYITTYEEIVDKELKYLEDYNLVKKSKITWLSGEFYFPLQRNEIYTTSDKIIVDTIRVDNWNIKASLNQLRVYSKSSVKFTAEASVFSTNTFVAKGASPLTFQTITQNNGNTLVQGASQSVFDGAYDPFTVGRLKVEVVSLFFNNSVGLSAAIEEDVFGDIKNTNWKFGIPFSLKGDDKNPKVNFELQWREVNNVRSLGIALGYNFGRFVR